jgi:hypothetical protein
MSDERFLGNEDGTVLDSLTNLMWKKNDSYLDTLGFVSYRRALKYQDKMNTEAFAGYSDWRLPNKREAHSLFEKLKALQDKYQMDIHIDPIFAPGGGFDTWTSNRRGKITAYVYSFNKGAGGHKEVDDTLNTSVRLVRGEFDNTRIKVEKVPEIRDIVTQGGGWR